LLKAVPSLSDERPRLYQIPGSVPQPGTIRAGCPFYSRCDLRRDVCTQVMPKMTRHSATQSAACWATQEMSKLVHA
jgi:peptide/nickel transport system ATP-binding protein